MGAGRPESTRGPSPARPRASGRWARQQEQDDRAGDETGADDRRDPAADRDPECAAGPPVDPGPPGRPQRVRGERDERDAADRGAGRQQRDLGRVADRDRVERERHRADDRDREEHDARREAEARAAGLLLGHAVAPTVRWYTATLYESRGRLIARATSRPIAPNAASRKAPASTSEA